MKMKNIVTGREEILEKARQCVCGDREDQYGSPEQNFQTIAEMWESYLHHPVAADDVAAMLALVKIERISSGRFKEDNWVDLAGYAACGGEIQANMKPQEWDPGEARINPEEVKVDVEKIIHDIHQSHGIRYTVDLSLKEAPVCPECGTPCATYYVDEYNNVCGCENCLSRTDAVQYILEEGDDDEDC